MKTVLFRKNKAHPLLAIIAATVVFTGCTGQDATTESVVPLMPETPAAGANEPETAEPGTSETKTAEPESPEPYDVLAERLQAPWAMAFQDGDNAIYISEREGSVVRIDEGGSLTRKPVRLQRGVYAVGEAGFLGFALKPDFEQTKQAYAYHTYTESGRTQNRIVIVEESEEAWTEVSALLEGIPGSNIHDGGRLAIGPDGHLYATTGDAGDGPLAQDRSSLAGKVLRMTLDGGVPQDNPFPDSYVYSYGHRNPQGFAWDADGIMYSSEHGPSGNPGGHDELNAIVAGGNYGWPTVYGGEQRDGMISPMYHSGDPAIAPSGVAADEEGRLLVATLRGQALYRFDPRTGQMETILEGEGRIRDVAVHNGRMYVITNNTDGRGSPAEADDRLLLLPHMQ